MAFFRLLIMTAFLAVPFAAFGAPAQSVPDTPASLTARSTPIAVEHEGSDSIGARLATRVREMMNASNLFTLNDQDVPKIRVLVSSVSEFQSRPAVGSAYAVVWVFSQSEGTLRHFLLREVGVLTPEDVDATAAKIVERTDGVAARYGYLFNR